MNEQPTDDQLDLDKQLADTKKELEEARKNQIIQVNPQDKFIETLFEKGGEILMSITKVTKENEKYTTDINAQIRREEFKIIDKLDTKEKIFKGSLLGLCIVALLVAAIYIDKAQSIIPVLSLLIGLLFKSSSLGDFISFSQKRKVKETEKINEE